MSSLVRTLQKRIMKRRGYVRQTSRVVIEPGNLPRLVAFKRGEGPVLTPTVDPWNGGAPGASFGPSRHWPRFAAKTGVEANG